MKLVKKCVEYVNKKDGAKMKGYNLYLKLDNGNLVAIRSSFKDDYKALLYIAELIG